MQILFSFHQEIKFLLPRINAQTAPTVWRDRSAFSSWKSAWFTWKWLMWAWLATTSVFVIRDEAFFTGAAVVVASVNFTATTGASVVVGSVTYWLTWSEIIKLYYIWGRKNKNNNTFRLRCARKFRISYWLERINTKEENEDKSSVKI